MQVKTFEIRDKGTFLTTLAVKLTSSNKGSREDYLLRRAGLNSLGSYHVLLWDLSKNTGHVDAYKWGNTRTYLVAHQHIEQNFDRLIDGSVIDVQFILGETSAPKSSEEIIEYVD